MKKTNNVTLLGKCCLLAVTFSSLASQEGAPAAARAEMGCAGAASPRCPSPASWCSINSSHFRRKCRKRRVFPLSLCLISEDKFCSYQAEGEGISESTSLARGQASPPSKAQSLHFAEGGRTTANVPSKKSCAHIQLHHLVSFPMKSIFTLAGIIPVGFILTQTSPKSWQEARALGCTEEGWVLRR